MQNQTDTSQPVSNTTSTDTPAIGNAPLEEAPMNRKQRRARASLERRAGKRLKKIKERIALLPPDQREKVEAVFGVKS